MNSRRCKPRRPLRNEALSLAPLALFIGLVALSFPRESLTWRAGEETPPDGAARCAFVELSSDVAARAREMVRSSFSPAASAVRNLRADLSLSTMAEDTPEDIVDISWRLRPAAPAMTPWTEVRLPRGMAAPEPDLVPPQAEPPSPAFSRQSMLEPDCD